MNNINRHSYIVFLSVTITFVTLFGFVFFVCKHRLDNIPKQKYKIIFNNASAYGINDGAPIFFRGFNVGNVKDIEFLEGNVIVNVIIYNDNYPVNESTKITSQLLDISGAHGLFIETPDLNASKKENLIFYASLNDMEQINAYIQDLLNMKHPEKFNQFIINIDELILLIKNTIHIFNSPKFQKQLDKVLKSLISLLDKIKNHKFLSF